MNDGCIHHCASKQIIILLGRIPGALRTLILRVLCHESDTGLIMGNWPSQAYNDSGISVLSIETSMVFQQFYDDKVRNKWMRICLSISRLLTVTNYVVDLSSGCISHEFKK